MLYLASNQREGTIIIELDNIVNTNSCRQFYYSKWNGKLLLRKFLDFLNYDGCSISFFC
jgi:hypothetical protein